MKILVAMMMIFSAGILTVNAETNDPGALTVNAETSDPRALTLTAETNGSQQKTRDVLHEFMLAVGHNDWEQAKSCLKESVTLPEIREKTPMGSVQQLPSTHDGSTVLVGYFSDGEDVNDGSIPRVAFIWEVTVKGDEISRIKVVSDDSNPRVNERMAVQEYKEKFKKELLVPAFFPFTVTHVDGEVQGNELVLSYRNEALKYGLEVRVVPRMNRSGAPKDYKEEMLEDGARFYLKQVDEDDVQSVFVYGDMEYTVKLAGENETFKPTENELVEVVKSMFPRSGERE